MVRFIEVALFTKRCNVLRKDKDRSRVRYLRELVDQVNNEKAALTSEKNEVVKAGARSLQDCQRENHELRVILEKIRVRLRVEGIDDFDKALGEIEENRVTAKEENEKNLQLELSSLMEKFEKSQQELAIFKSGEGSSSHQSNDLSEKLSLANDELLCVKT
ncbi:hypothetical protein C5167_026011 [Papaver somniferum]|nr:hypothetical protein C5167_026011 [Papaver somniferum]